MTPVRCAYPTRHTAHLAIAASGSLRCTGPLQGPPASAEGADACCASAAGRPRSVAAGADVTADGRQRSYPSDVSMVPVAESRQRLNASAATEAMSLAVPSVAVPSVAPSTPRILARRSTCSRRSVRRPSPAPGRHDSPPVTPRNHGLTAPLPASAQLGSRTSPCKSAPAPRTGQQPLRAPRQGRPV